MALFQRRRRKRALPPVWTRGRPHSSGGASIADSRLVPIQIRGHIDRDGILMPKG